MLPECHLGCSDYLNVPGARTEVNRAELCFVLVFGFGLRASDVGLLCAYPGQPARMKMSLWIKAFSKQNIYQEGELKKTTSYLKEPHSNEGHAASWGGTFTETGGKVGSVLVKLMRSVP